MRFSSTAAITHNAANQVDFHLGFGMSPPLRGGSSPLFIRFDWTVCGAANFNKVVEAAGVVPR